jgi:hypothetical protein
MPNKPRREPGPPCEKCGKSHLTPKGNPACTGHKSPARGGAACRNAPIRGLTVCRVHGGSSKKVREAAQVNVAIARAERQLNKIAPELDEIEAIKDPVDMLARLAARCEWMVTTLADMVNQLKDQLATTDQFNVQHVKALVILYERALDRAMTAAYRLAQLGFAERQIRLDENTAAALIGAHRRALEATIADKILRARVIEAIVHETRQLEEVS